MTVGQYEFDVEEVFNKIREDWTGFMDSIHMKKCVIGISGGKDSTVCAYLAAKIFGPENVYGVMLPCDEQPDIADSEEVIKLTGIHRIMFNISDAYYSMIEGVENNAIDLSENTEINLPPRLRMAALYAFAQSVDGLVLNCDNLCEICAGYYTLFGDGAGSYGPLRDLTVHEVLELGKYLGVSPNLLYKTPGDGLQPLGDEERLGFTYQDMHNIIRNNDWSSGNGAKIIEKQIKNEFKLKIVNIPHPEFNFPNFLENSYGN